MGKTVSPETAWAVVFGTGKLCRPRASALVTGLPSVSGGTSLYSRFRPGSGPAGSAPAGSPVRGPEGLVSRSAESPVCSRCLGGRGEVCGLSAFSADESGCPAAVPSLCGTGRGATLSSGAVPASGFASSAVSRYSRSGAVSVRRGSSLTGRPDSRSDCPGACSGCSSECRDSVPCVC